MGKSKQKNKHEKYQHKLVDGKENPNYVDLLDEDKPISGQKFVCVSFISPEKIIKQKELFYFDEFLKKWDMNKSMEKFYQFLNFVSFKYHLSFDDITKDLEDFVSEEKENIVKTGVTDDYKTFLDNNEEELQNKYNKKNKFQTSTRGIKIRGAFPTMEEAELRCKILRELDPNHDVFVGPVGMWMPWDPEAYKTGRVEYMEDELNQLMSEKQKNEYNAKNEFERHVKETKQKAIEENKEKSTKYGSTISQTINEEGNLVSINNFNTQANKLESNENVTLDDIKNELFEGDNIVIDKNTDHGRSLLKSGPFALNNDVKNNIDETTNDNEEESV